MKALSAKIEGFHKSLGRIVDAEYQRMKEAVLAAVEDIFDHSKEKVRRLYRAEGEHLNK